MFILTALVRHLPYRIRIALLAILIGIHAALLLVAVRILCLLLFLPLVLFLLLLALDVLGILRITSVHDRLHSGQWESTTSCREDAGLTT